MLCETSKKFFTNFHQICQIVENSGMDLLWDSKAGVAILSNGTRGVVTPTPKSVMATVEFVMTAGLRGVMILSTPEDDFTPYCGKVKYPLSKSANFAMTRAENEALKGKKFCFYKYRNLFQNPSILLPTKTSSNIMYALVNSTIELNCSGIGEPDINLAWVSTLNKKISDSTGFWNVHVLCQEKNVNFNTTHPPIPSLSYSS